MGCAGYVKIGNTLTEPITEDEVIINLSQEKSNYWYTPMYFHEIWHYRRMFRMMDRFYTGTVNEDTTNKKTVTNADNTHEVPAECELNIDDNGQILLF